VMTRAGGFPFAGALTPSDIFRMTPFSVIRRMSEEMDRVFGEFGLNRTEAGAQAWSPTIEVLERDNNLIFRAHLAGVKPDDVKIQITDEAIVLEGERVTSQDEDRSGVHITEVQYGRFYRAMPLPEGADVENARATFNQGVLEVTIPLRQEQRSRAREIPIQSGDESGQQRSSGSSSSQQASSGSEQASGGSSPSGSSSSGSSERSSGSSERRS
jgi:HSP20 family protein